LVGLDRGAIAAGGKLEPSHRSAGEQPAAAITTAAVESRQKSLGWKAILPSLRDSG